jgi:hypothetical protein
MSMPMMTVSRVLLAALTAISVSCSSREATLSRTAKIPFEEQFVKGAATKTTAPLPTDGSKDSILTPSPPNPFSPSTTIDFNVAREDTVRISFYDSDGRLIGEAFRGYLPAGAYRFELTQAHVNSGVYIAKFQVGNRSSTRKVMILR